MPDFEFFPVPRAAQQDPLPRLIATIPYTDFAASSTYYAYYSGVLNRRARARTLIVFSTLNESITSVGFYPYDSTTQTGNPATIDGGFTWGSGPGTNGLWIQTSEQASAGPAGALAAHVDSFEIGLGMGATAPTSGQVTIWIVEVF